MISSYRASVIGSASLRSGLRPCKALSSIVFSRAFNNYVLSPFETIEVTSLSLSNSWESDSAIAMLAFDRPHSRNAISKQLLHEFSSYVHALATNDPAVSNIRALILTSSTPNIFSAGADLKERKTFSQSDTENFLHQLNQTLGILSNLKIPTISSIQGLALGGGLEIALSTDFRVLGTTAQVGLTETRLAIIPGAGGTYRLPHLIGTSRALDLILTGRRVSAEEALTFGIANRVAEDADQESIRLAREICEGGPLAIVAAKQAVRGASPEWERTAHKQVVNSKDKFEALQAFAEKRKPIFKGE